MIAEPLGDKKKNVYNCERKSIDFKVKLKAAKKADY